MNIPKALMVSLVTLSLAASAPAALSELGSEVLVSTTAGEIAVPGYSVPSIADWDGDGLADLIVGEGGSTSGNAANTGTQSGKIRVYLNVGTATSPSFTDYMYAQSGTSDLQLTGSGCMGVFPRVVDWNGDTYNDLLVGMADGRMMLYRNSSTDGSMTFGAGELLAAGGIVIDVGARATGSVVDWNNDGRPDLVSGAYDGTVKVFLNVSDTNEPALVAPILAQTTVGTLDLSASRSSPVVMDIDGDGMKDLLVGNTYGQMLIYTNVGTDQSPVFSPTFNYLRGGGSIIDLAGSARSRPFVGDFDGDGFDDVLIGGADGKLHLYTAVPEPTTLALFTLGLARILRRRKR